MNMPPLPQSHRSAPPLSAEAQRDLLRKPHPLDLRDPFANDPDERVRELGRLALRRTNVNDSFALGDLCARLALNDTGRLLVFYVGKTLMAYRRAAQQAENDVDRTLAQRARERFVDWVINVTRAHMTRRNIAVALWAIADDDDLGQGQPIATPRKAPSDLLVALLSLHGAPLPSSRLASAPDNGHNSGDSSGGDASPLHKLDGATITPFGVQTQFAGAGDDPMLSVSLDDNAIADSYLSANEVGMTEGELKPANIPLSQSNLEVGTEAMAAPIIQRPPAAWGDSDSFEDSVSDEYHVGDRIANRYEVADVKVGGMGVVYLCYDHELREPVALKSFKNEYLDNPRAIARFEQEALTWIKLDKNRHVVNAHWVERINGRPFILLEHVSGPEGMGADLRHWIERRRVTLELAILFGLHIALGMQHVFQRTPGGLVHRDLKPANILVTQDAVAKVTDFGLVRTLDRSSDIAVADTNSTLGDADERLTRAGALVGTIMYMSPEQWTTREVDLRSDVYACGIILYELLTGHHPFQMPHGARDPAHWQRAHLTQIATFSIAETNAIPAALRSLCLQCMAKAPADRPDSWGQIVDQLTIIYRDTTGDMPQLEIVGPELLMRDLMDKGYSLTELGRLEEAVAVYDQAIALQDDSAWAFARKGRALRLLGEYDAALVCLDRAIALQPRYAWAWRGKGMVLELNGSPQEALQCYETAASFDPTDVWNWYNQADMLSELGRTDEAIVALQAALRIDPTHANIWAKLGQLYRKNRDYSSARHAFEEALRHNPRLGWAHNGYGLVLRTLGAPKEALLAFKRAARHQPDEVIYWYNIADVLIDLTQYDEALKAARQVVRVDSGYANGWAKLGQALRYLGRMEEALEAYRKATQLDSVNAWSINGYAMVLEKLERFAEALVGYDRAVALERDNISFRYNRANVLALLGRTEEALTALREITTLQPDYAPAWSRMGSVERQHGDMTRALDAYQRAIAIDPGYAWAWHELALAYEHSGQFAEAVNAHEHATAAAPDDPAYVAALASSLVDSGDGERALSTLNEALKRNQRSDILWMKLGGIYYRQRRFSEALASFNRVTEHNGRHDRAWNGRGLALMALGRTEEALLSFRRALENAPEEATYLYNQGDALLSLGHYRASVDVFERALRIDPDRAATWAKLGQTFRRLERDEDAVNAYDRALALEADYAWAWHGRGLALNGLDKCEEAAACYEKAIALENGVVWYYTSLIDVWVRMEHIQEADRLTQEMIERFPESSIVWSRRGQVLRRTKAYSAAVEAYDRALALDPMDAWSWNGRGLALAVLNRWDDALDAHETATQLDGSDAWYWYNCGEAWLQLDQPARAIERLQEGLKRDPNHEALNRLLAQAQDRLRRDTL